MIRSAVKFWSVVRLVWAERLVYRVNFFLEVLSGILSSLIIVFLWMAIYRSAPHGSIGGYSLSEMVTYILGGGLINSFILTTAENPETSQSIRDGSLSDLLIKPVSPYGVWLARDLGNKVFHFLLGFIGYVLVFLFFREYLVFPENMIYIPLFLVSMMLAAFLQFLLFEALSLLAFWLENTYGIRFTMRVIMEVAGGAIIPLSFFPHIIQKIFLYLPFQFLIYLPMRLYLGKIPLEQVYVEFLKELSWIAVLVILNILLWRRGVRQYLAMGD